MADFGFTEKGLVIAGNLMATWEEIDKERNYFRLANHVLVKVSFSYGRASDLYDHWLLPKAKWENIHACLEGQSAWYSDFAGKHSEVELNFWGTVGLEVVSDFKTLSEFHERNGWSESNMEIIMEALSQLCDNGVLNRKEDGTYSIVEEDEEN